MNIPPASGAFLRKSDSGFNHLNLTKSKIKGIIATALGKNYDVSTTDWDHRTLTKEISCAGAIATRTEKIFARGQGL